MDRKLDKYKLPLVNLLDYSTIIFDLDDTLYSEIEYLKFAFSQIAVNVSRLNKNLNEMELNKFLIENFISAGRINLYDKFVSKYNINNYGLEHYLKVLRNVNIKPNSIRIKPLIEKFIKDNISNYKFFIATNGNTEQQKNKIKSICIPHLDSFTIIYCNTLGKNKNKPSSAFIDKIVVEYNIIRENIIFIGDSYVDLHAANNGNIQYLNINKFEQILIKG